MSTATCLCASLASSTLANAGSRHTPTTSHRTVVSRRMRQCGLLATRQARSLPGADQQPPSTKRGKSQAVTRSSASEASAPATITTVLHGFPTSSTSFLARFALNVKGVDYLQETIPVVKLPNGKPHPDGVKPYLEAHGAVVYRPGAIFNHINETFEGPALLPEDPAGRARCRTLATLCATEVAPFGYYRALRLLQDELGVNEEGIKTWRQYWISHGFQEIESLLEASPEQTGRFLHGDSMTMADIFIMPQVHHSQLPTTIGGPFSLAEYPMLEQVYKNCLEEEAFIQALPENNQ